MKLKKIYFDAFKSLFNKELEIKHDCVGFVGTNESGKSNILYAINVLSGNRKLSAADIPKMAKGQTPKLRFVFELSKTELQTLKSGLEKWVEEATTISVNQIKFVDNTIEYTVFFDTNKKVENRFFSYEKIEVNKDLIFLKKDKESKYYQFFAKAGGIPLEQAQIISIKDLSDHFNIVHDFDQLKVIDQEIETGRREIVTINQAFSNLPPLPEAAEGVIETPDYFERQTLRMKSDADIMVINANIEDLLKEKKDIENKLHEYKSTNFLAEFEKQYAIIENSLKTMNTQSELCRKKIHEIEVLPTPDDNQKKELDDNRKKLHDLITNSDKALRERDDLSARISDLNERLDEKFSDAREAFDDLISEVLEGSLLNFIPKIVFWEHNANYILQSETLFSDILNKGSFDNISRPLANVFRIGLDIHSYEELTAKIIEIQNDSNERSRFNKTLNTRLNDFIKKIWVDYDQNINITLEKEQIRIEIFDPKPNDPSYYNMEERSQGCKTFLSFLLTIGAEAEHGVITDTILLLDEPETHLHPSGVRFMLHELIKISEKGNLVLYATHSIFLIDRNNFDRHIILEKEKEHTIIKPANIGRIGYFMQEEVLYNTLDLDLSKDLSSHKKYNFVFEGDGDVTLFDHYYHNILKPSPFPAKDSFIIQGGKCSGIQKYLTNKPLQLGTKWIFVLDKDKPANELRKFIEGKYRDYIGKDIHVFQYDINDLTTIELEDLLPDNLIKEVYQEICEFLGIDYATSGFEKNFNENKGFGSYHSKFLKSNNLEDEALKGKLKEILNNKIKVQLSVAKSEEAFRKIFSKYENWVKSIITELQKKPEISV